MYKILSVTHMAHSWWETHVNKHRLAAQLSNGWSCDVNVIFRGSGVVQAQKEHDWLVWNLDELQGVSHFFVKVIMPMFDNIW